MKLYKLSDSNNGYYWTAKIKMIPFPSIEFACSNGESVQIPFESIGMFLKILPDMSKELEEWSTSTN